MCAISVHMDACGNMLVRVMRVTSDKIKVHFISIN